MVMIVVEAVSVTACHVGPIVGEVGVRWTGSPMVARGSLVLDKHGDGSHGIHSRVGYQKADHLVGFDDGGVSTSDGDLTHGRIHATGPRVVHLDLCT